MENSNHVSQAFRFISLVIGTVAFLSSSIPTVTSAVSMPPRPFVEGKNIPQTNANLAQNGGFESGNLNSWTSSSTVVPSVQNVEANTGSFAVKLGGQNSIQTNLYQLVVVPTWMQSGDISFWVKITAPVVDPGNDVFCARLYSVLPTDPHTQKGQLDLGCVTGTYQGVQWRKMDYPLFGPEIDSLRGLTLYLYFYYESDGSNPTTILLDDVSFLVSDEAGDLHEPNNSPNTATRLISGNTITDLTTSPAGDDDWFVISGLTGQLLTVYIYAAQIESPLTAQVLLYDSSLNQLTADSFDTTSTDPFLSYTLPANGNYYIVVSSYDGQGGPDYYYQLNATLSNLGLTASINSVGSQNAPSPKVQSPAATKEWTFIYYLNLDDKTRSAKFTQDWIDQYIWFLAKQINVKDSLANVVVLADGPGNGDTYRYTLHPSYLMTKEYMGELDMGDPNSLQTFANWAMQNYPAQHYMLTISDHGAGVRGISRDDNSGGNALDIRKLRSVMDTVTIHGSRRIDLLYYEACLMALYEEAYDMRNYANYLVASQSLFGLSPMHSYVAGALSAMQPGWSGKDLGLALMNDIQTSNTYPEAVALIDLSKMSDLASAVSSLAVPMLAPAWQGDPMIMAIRNSTQMFDANQSGNKLSDPYLDLWDLADQDARANPTNQAVQSTVLAQVVKSELCGQVYNHCYSRSHGLSVFWPLLKDNKFGDYIDEDHPLFEINAYGKSAYDNVLKWWFAARSQQGQVLSSNGRTPTSNWFLSSPGLPVDPDMPGPVTSYLYLPIILK